MSKPRRTSFLQAREKVHTIFFCVCECPNQKSSNFVGHALIWTIGRGHKNVIIVCLCHCLSLYPPKKKKERGSSLPACYRVYQTQYEIWDQEIPPPPPSSPFSKLIGGRGKRGAFISSSSSFYFACVQNSPFLPWFFFFWWVGMCHAGFFICSDLWHLSIFFFCLCLIGLDTGTKRKSLIGETKKYNWGLFQRNFCGKDFILFSSIILFWCRYILQSWLLNL